MRVTKNNISKAIKEKTGYDIGISSAYGYFYFYSDDKETDLMLKGWETTSIYSNFLTHQSVEGWVRDFERLMQDNNQ
jgi:hypothetical protein